MLVAGGPKYILLAALLYAPGTWLFWRARREQGSQVFTHLEAAAFTGICLMAMTAFFALLTGRLSI
jgi:arginine:ornithine antiporter/lysine permease